MCLHSAVEKMFFESFNYGVSQLQFMVIRFKEFANKD